jgi:hypothetical protein
MDPQLTIKILLSVGVVIVGLGFAWPGRGARRLALRRIGVLLVAAAAIVAIAAPSLTDKVAQAVGIGRGADLLLYGLTIAFGIYAIGARRERNLVRTELLAIARAHAIAQAPDPAGPSPVASRKRAAADSPTAARE